MSFKPKALVTAGATIEKIDPVRFISNFSSGKQGVAIAKALQDRGFEVTLLCGTISVAIPDGIKVLNVISAQEMFNAAMQQMPQDVVVCVAAVADWRVKDVFDSKIKKQENIDEMTLTLVKNPDILASIANLKDIRPKFVVGFALESSNELENAKKKLVSKNCDLIVANKIDNEANPFSSDSNSVFFISRDYEIQLKNESKEIIAEKLVDKIYDYIYPPE